MADLGVQYQGVVVDGLLTPGSVVSYLSMPDGTTLGQAVSGAAVWAAAIDGTIDGAFTQLQVTITPHLPDGLKSATGTTWAASRIEQTGVIDFSATGTSRRWGFALPSLSNSVIRSGHIDLANAAIVALIDLLLNPTDLFSNPQQQVLEAALDALISFRKRAQLRKRSLDLQ
jgi:hypothetical protein